MRTRAPFGNVMGGFLLASIVAPLVGGVVFSLLLSGGEAAYLEAVPAILLYSLIFGVPVALGHALLLGLPAYLGLERHYRLHWWSAMMAGGVIGAAPVLLLLRPVTAWDVISLLLIAGGSGVVGGLVFWAALRDLMRTR